VVALADSDEERAGVEAMLGLAAQDHIVAFLYLGTTAIAGTATAASLEGIVTWTK
jgi:hypothetical protein